MRKIILSILLIISNIIAFSQTELVQDGSFATPFPGDVKWTWSPNFYYNQNYSNWYSAPGYAYLATSTGVAGNNLDGQIWQSLTDNLPSNITAFTLSYQYSVSTNETTTTTEYDYVDSFLLIDGTEYFLNRFSNLNNNNGSYDLNSETFSGSLVTNINNANYVTLLFRGHTDGASESVMRIDDVSFIVYTSSSNNYDLSISNESVSNTNVNIGDQIDLSCRQEFSGSCGDDYLDPNPYVGYFLSANQTYENGNDLEIATDSSSIGDNDDSDPESENNWTIPSSVSAGNYYILFVADYDNQHSESNEGNNTQSVAITINSSSCTGISITQQPTNQTVTSGNSATFSVSATGTPTITYQWTKNGTNISGATSSTYTTPTLTTSDSGNTYMCKVTNCDGTVNSNVATATVNNTTSGSITGNLSVPYIDDNFQLQNGSTNGFTIKLYENGNSTPLMQTTLNSNDNFSFTNVPQGSYHIIAEKLVSGNLVSSVQENFVSTGSSISLKSSYNLINQIDNYNTILFDLTCEIDITNSTYHLLNSLNHSYYTTNSESYILNTSNNFIVDNDDFVIDKLSRLMIVNKATKQYFDDAKELTNEYMTTLKDATEIFYQFLSYLRCRGLIVDGSSYIPNILIDAFKTLYVEVLSNITINGENILNSSTIESSFDLILSYVSGQNQFAFIDYADTFTVIGLDQIWINNFVNRGYVYKTYDSFNNSINNVINNNQSLTLNELGNFMQQRLYEANSLVINTNINVTSYRNLPDWINMTFELSDILATNTCNSVLLLIGTLTNVLEATLVYDSMLHSYIGKSDLKNRANTNISYSSNRFQGVNIITNDPDFILPLIQTIENKLNLYNTKLQNSISTVNNNTFSDTMYDELSTLTSEIIEIQNILSNSFITLKPNSNLTETIFDDKLNQSMFKSPASRLAFLITFKEYLNQQDTTITSDLNNNYQELIIKNQLTITNLYDLKNSLSSTDLQVNLGVINNKIPSVININETNNYSLDIFNYGSTVANNVILEIQSTNSNATFTQTVFNIGNANPFTKFTANIPIQTNSNTGETSYTLKITSNSTSNVEIDRVLTTFDATLLSIDEFNNYNDFFIYPNPVENTINFTDISKIDKIEIYNNLGQKILTKEHITKKIDIKELKSGMYYLKIYTGNNTKSIKFIKR